MCENQRICMKVLLQWGFLLVSVFVFVVVGMCVCVFVFLWVGISIRSVWVVVFKGLKEIGVIIIFNYSFVSLVSVFVEKCFKK